MKENKANKHKSIAKMRASTKSLLLTRPEPSPEQLQCYICLFVCFVFCFFKAFAEENGFVGELKHWDIPFWSQKQREHLFRFEQGTSYNPPS